MNRAVILLLPALWGCGFDILTEDLSWGGQEGSPDGYDPDTTEGGSSSSASTCAFDAADYGYTAPADPWDAAEIWRWDGNADEPDQRHAMSSPAIGDVDGDGDVEIAFTAFCDGGSACAGEAGLHLVDGATGEEIWYKAGYHWISHTIIADVDGDGDAEILAALGSSSVAEDLYLQAVDADGNVLWTATEPLHAPYASFTVADLDADGTPEIATGAYVFDGATGALEASFGSDPYTPYQYFTPVLADLDLDGAMEVIVGQDAFAPDGTALWSGPLTRDPATIQPYAAPVSYDADPEGELLVVGGAWGGEMAILDSDGSTLLTADLGRHTAHPPCVADFDGDGEQEFAVGGWSGSGAGGYAVISVVELDGTVLWTAQTDGLSGTPSCSAFDLDWDGADELLFLDDSAYVFDGSDGTIRYQYDDLGVSTGFGYPIPADLDGDGSVELLLTASSYTSNSKSGVIALSHAEGGWPPGGPAWPMHDYAVTNVSADLTLPAAPDPSWQCGYYRGRPPIDP